jgi:ABC-type phosphate transport system permease subunit
LAGIPSVVYGFGLVVIVPLIQSLLIYLGETAFSGKCGACNHGFAYIITISEDACNTPRAKKKRV